jgi:hypothetical protein
LNEPSYFKISLSEVKNYTLFDYTDDEGSPVKVSVQANIDLLPTIKIGADQQYLTFNMTDFVIIGTQTINIILCDIQPMCSTYPLIL